MTNDLLEAAKRVRKNAYAPYSNYLVGAAVRTDDGQIFTGCNVENVAYPEGTCAEAGAIAAMCAAGSRTIVEVAVIGSSDAPVPPCGGCRQKIAEFADSSVPVTLASTKGDQVEMSVAELLPGAFDKDHLKSGQ